MDRSRLMKCLVSLALVSCGDGVTLSLDEEEYIERSESRARRMNVRVVTPGSDEPSELTTADFLAEYADELAVGCDQEIADSLVVDVSNVTSSTLACTNAVREDLLYVDCQFARLGELVESELPVELRDPNGGVAVTVLPQTPEARGELAKLVLEGAALLTARSGDTLRAVASGTTDMTPLRLSECGSAADLAPMAFGSTTSVGALVASILTSNVSRAEAMGARYGALQHAVAEAELSLSSSLNVATRLGWLDPTMSRAAAVRLLTGGEGGTGIYGYSSDGAGPCATEEPTEDTRGAIHILRASGLPPAIVTDLDVPLRSLLVGGSELGSTLPFQVRAGVLTGDNRFFTAMNEQDMASTLGTSLGALETARRYLAQERIAFARDDDQQVVGGIPVSPDLSGSERALQNVHAGLLREPEGVPSAFSVARVRFADPELTSARVDDRATTGPFKNQPNYTDEPGLMPVSSFHLINSSDVHRVSVGGIVDYALAVASDLGSLDSSIGTWTPLPTDIRAELSRFLTGNGERRPHRLQICAISTGRSQRDEVRVEALATNMDTGRLRIVRGVSGLRCATEGQIEGEPCTLFDEDPNTVNMDVSDQTTKFTVEPLANERWFGATHAAGVRTSPIRFDPSGNGGPNDFVFVVMQKPGVTNPRPGDFVALGGVRLLSPTRSNSPGKYDHCTVHPVMPELFEKVDELVEMDTTYCALSKLSCAGIAEGEAIPLENELTSDGDGVESSWRHYLNLASTAALHADQLGEALIGAGSAIDEQAELAEDAVRSLCGDSVNVGDAFWDLLDEAPAGPCVCPPDASCSACAPGYLCDAGMCRRDIDAYIRERAATDSAYEALAQCLSSAGVIPYATPGAHPVCAWRLPGDDDLCGELDGDRDFTCPWAASASAARLPNGATGVDASMYCTLPDGLPVGATAVLVTTRLGIFESPTPPSDGGSEERTAFACDEIRRYRLEDDPDRRLELASKIIESLSLPEVAEIAARTSWRGYPDDYSAILVNGKVWRATGRPESSTPDVSEWPCGVGSSVCSGGPDAEGGLFCASVAGRCGVVETENDRVLRAAMNHRMARAVMTLRMITGRSMANIQVPFMPELRALTLEADVERDQEFGKVKWSFDGSAMDAITLRGSRSVGRGDRVEFEIWEQDAARDDNGTYARDGMAYCEEGGTGRLWTHIGANAWRRDGSLNLIGPGGDSAPTYEPIVARCEALGVPYRSRSSAVLPLVFASVSGDVPDRGPALADAAWQGMGAPVSIDELADYADEWTGAVDEKWLVRMFAGSQYARGSWRSLSVDEGQVSCSIRNPGGNRQRWRCDGEPPFTSYFFADEYNRVSPLRNVDGAEPEGGSLDGWVPGTESILDALELACEISADDVNNPDPLGRIECGDWDASANIDVANLREGQRLLQCMAEEVRSRGSMVILSDLPADAVAALTDPSALEGERGREASDIAVAIVELASFPDRLATELEDAALLLRLARNAVDRNEVQMDLADLERVSTNLRETTSCISAALNAVAQAGGEWWQNAARAGAAAATCANSIGQIVIAAQRAALQRELIGIDTDSELTEITRSLARTLAAMNELASQAKQAEIQLRSAAGSAETRRAQVMNQVEDILVTYGNPSAPANVRRRVYTTARIRYEEAHQRAIRTAWMARRALEQRLGVSLRDLNDPMHLVEAPARWADRLCTMRGFDYRAISRDYDLPGGDDYSVEYVGDYVRRLEDVFESYSVDFPFVDGEDVAVVSMKEDVVRAPLLECRVPTHNLLAYSGELSVREDPEVRATIEPGERDEVELPVVWSREGCSSVSRADADGHVSTFVGGCVSTTQTGETINEFAPAANESVTRVVFGGVGLGPAGVEQLRQWQPQARIAQRIDLPAGRYRLSWYGREQVIPMVQSVNPSSVVSPRTVAGAPLTTVSATYSQWLADGWSRHFRFFELPEGSVVDISITSPTPDSLTGGQPTLPMVFDIAGLMLEEVGAQVPSLASMPDGAAYPPRAYITTVGNGEGYLAACEDVSGARFRSEWQYGCERVCPAGPGTCADGRLACFWERPFEVNLDDVERGSRFRRSGFAIGNYNYRWMSLGVNLVGTGIRDCSSSDSPSTCYGAGYVPFSIHHDASDDGGYPVRNHQGDVYIAPLFPGRVQYARSLAAERYLSNPLSGTDRALIEPYLRTELRGRPLTGRYTMRVWDDGGLDWSRVEDIQLVLGYRYWTRTR